MPSQDALDTLDVVESPLAGTHDGCDVIIDGGGLDGRLWNINKSICQTLHLRHHSVDVSKVGGEVADQLVVVTFMVD